MEAYNTKSETGGTPSCCLSQATKARMPSALAAAHKKCPTFFIKHLIPKNPQMTSSGYPPRRSRLNYPSAGRKRLFPAPQRTTKTRRPLSNISSIISILTICNDISNCKRHATSPGKRSANDNTGEKRDIRIPPKRRRKERPPCGSRNGYGRVVYPAAIQR